MTIEIRPFGHPQAPPGSSQRKTSDQLRLAVLAGGRPAYCEPEAATFGRRLRGGPGAALGRGRRRAGSGPGGRPQGGSSRPTHPAQRLPGEPVQFIGADRQSRRARPGPPHRSGDRELSHFLAVAIRRELAPLAAGTKAEVVDLVGAAAVLEGGDGRAPASSLTVAAACQPRPQAFSGARTRASWTSRWPATPHGFAWDYRGRSGFDVVDIGDKTFTMLGPRRLYGRCYWFCVSIRNCLLGCECLKGSNR